MLCVFTYVNIDELYAGHWFTPYPDKEVLYVSTYVNIDHLYTVVHLLTLYADKDALYDVNADTTLVI